MTSRERRRAAEGRFIQQQRYINFKGAFFWFIKRLILFTILIVYTVIGAYAFQVSRLRPSLLCLLRENNTAVRSLAVAEIPRDALYHLEMSDRDRHPFCSCR